MVISVIAFEPVKNNMCSHLTIITDFVNGEEFCQSCGQIMQERLEENIEPALNQDDYFRLSRVGPPNSLTLHDKGLNTIIGAQNRDSVGKPLSVKNAQLFHRLRKWDSRSQTKSSANSNLRLALLELCKVQSKLGLSDTVIERAALFYRKAIEKNLIRGRSVKSIAAACLYASCRDLEHNRTLIEIANQFMIHRKEIVRAYHILFRELGFVVSIADPTKSIIKVASKVGITEKTIRKAIEILDAAQDAGIVSGKNPEIIAATVIYVACIITGETKSQLTIATAAGTSTVSIRNRLSEFKTKLGLFSIIN